MVNIKCTKLHYEPVRQTTLIGGLGRIAPTCPLANQHITRKWHTCLDSECTTEKPGLVELKSKAAIEIMLTTSPVPNRGANGVKAGPGTYETIRWRIDSTITRQRSRHSSEPPPRSGAAVSRLLWFRQQNQRPAMPVLFHLVRWMRKGSHLKSCLAAHT